MKNNHARPLYAKHIITPELCGQFSFLTRGHKLRQWFNAVVLRQTPDRAAEHRLLRGALQLCLFAMASVDEAALTPAYFQELCSDSFVEGVEPFLPPHISYDRALRAGDKMGAHLIGLMEQGRVIRADRKTRFALRDGLVHRVGLE